MSRIGKTPIELPAGVTLEKEAAGVLVKGPKGSLHVDIPSGFAVTTEAQVIKLIPASSATVADNIYGLVRSLLANAIFGVAKEWQKTVELVGVGYRVSGTPTEVTLNVGFTHPVKVTAPKNITFTITDNTKITVSGIDKKVVGEIAAKLRSIKPPEPYKGKGIRYSGEVVRKKAGKAVKAIGAPA